MKNDIKNEMDGCRRLFDATVACTEGTNDFDDAALDSDGARNGLWDMVFDFVAFARQMAVDEMPGDPLRFAASSLRQIRREWDTMRFFDRETYQEGFPSHHDVINAMNNNIGNRKRNANQFSWNSLPTDTCAARDNVNGAPTPRMRTSSPFPDGSEYLGLPNPRHDAQSPTGGQQLNLPPIPRGDSVNRWVSDLVSEIEPVRTSTMDHLMANLDDADALARGRGIINGLTPQERARRRIANRSAERDRWGRQMEEEIRQGNRLIDEMQQQQREEEQRRQQEQQQQHQQQVQQQQLQQQRQFQQPQVQQQSTAQRQQQEQLQHQQLQQLQQFRDQQLQQHQQQQQQHQQHQ